MVEKINHLQELSNALESKELPAAYFNGFIASIGSGDVMIVLKQRDDPILILNASHTVAKSLAVKLGDLIASFEQKTGNIIMTTDDFQNKLMESKDDEVKD